ncbi:MAG: class I SAM-dependent methyltransferase [Stenotrophobium sp.]
MNEVLGAVVPCKLCGNASHRLCELDNPSSATRVLDIYRCTGCGIVFVGNKITSAELSQAYNHDWSDYYKTIEYENRRKMLHSIDDIRRLASNDAVVLDIGAGSGMFTQEFYKAGFKRLAAHEIPGSKLQHLEAIGCKIYQDFDYQCLPSDSFDVVTLLDVVEHVVDPQFLLDACYRVLKPGGVVYFHTPVVAFMDRVMHGLLFVPGLRGAGRMWQRGRTNVYHLQNFTPAALRSILSKAGLAEVVVKTRNELSWPLWAYVEKYLTSRFGWPTFTARLLTPLFWPFLATSLFNSNKAIAWARKPAASGAP